MGKHSAEYIEYLKSLYREHASFQAVGDKAGLSRERVRQILGPMVGDTKKGHMQTLEATPEEADQLRTAYIQVIGTPGAMPNYKELGAQFDLSAVVARRAIHGEGLYRGIGKIPPQPKSPRRKFSKAEIEEIRRAHNEENASAPQLAAKYKVGAGLIRRVLNGRGAYKSSHIEQKRPKPSERAA